MSTKLKKTPLIVILSVVLAIVIFACTDLYYHFSALHSFINIAFVVAIAACYTLLFILANAFRETPSKTLVILLPIIFTLALVGALIIAPLFLSESNRMYFYWAQIFTYVAFGLELVGFIIFLLFLGSAVRKKIVAVTCGLILAVSITAITCWAVFDNSILNATVSFSWQLDAPEYEATHLSRVYNCGVMTGDEYHDQKNGGPDAQTSFMQIVSRTNRTAFDKYCKKVVDAGYKETARSKIESIVSRTYQKDGKMLHVYFNSVEKTVRVITDPVSVSPQVASYSYTVKDTDEVKIYQYALMYDDDCEPGYKYGGGIERCGMNYVIKLADNKLVIIDGGDICQASDSAVEGFYELCKEISGVGEGEKIKIACWMGTHGHGDHILFFNKFLRVYHDDIVLERYMYNYGNWKEIGERGDVEAQYDLARRLELYAPNALAIKPHTGQVFHFAGTKIEILYTHEDGFNYHTNATDIEDFNDTSVTYRFTFFDKTTFIVTGDMSRCAQFVVNKNYTATTLKTDILQAAHHGFNRLDDLYPVFDAEYVFFPQGYDNAALGENDGAGYTYEFLLNKTRVTEKHIYLINRYTYGLFIDANGAIAEDPQVRPYIGPDFTKGQYFDGSAN